MDGKSCWRAVLTSFALAVAQGAAAAPMTVLIWGGGRSPEAARKALQAWEANGERAGLKLPDGYPRIVESTPIPGLKPGFHVVVLGFCAPEPGAAALARVKEAEPGAYLRDVDAPALACPEVLPRAAAGPAAPPQKLYALVVASGKSRPELEARATKYLQEARPGVKLAPGYPLIEPRKRVPLAGDREETYWLLAGVCSEDRAAALEDLAGAPEHLELLRGTPACPAVLEAGVEPAFRKALGSSASRPLALELAAMPMPGALRARLATLAAAACEAELVEKLLAGGAIDAGAALAAAADCSPIAYGSADLAEVARAAEGLARRLLRAGASAKGHGDWVAKALARDRLPVAKALVEAGADPRAAANDVLSAAVSASPEALAWALSFKLGKGAAGAASLYQAAWDRQPEHVRLLLRAGADASWRGNDGRTALDLHLLPGPHAVPEVAQALVEARPAFAAAFRGDAGALAALPPASLDERWGGWSPLAVAAVRGQDAAALVLLEHGADPAVIVAPEAKAGGWDLLHLAIAGGATKLAVTLVVKGAPREGLAPACCVARQADKDLVQLRPTLDAGYHDPKLPPLVKLRPLHRAAAAGQVVVVQALLQAGAAPDATDGSGLGLTASMLAAQRGQVAVLKPLAAAKASGTAVDAGGYSAVAHAMLVADPGPVVAALQAAYGKKVLEGAPGALAAAVRHAPPSVAEALLAGGAGKKGEGRRAVQLACELGQEQWFSILEDRGFKTGKQFWGGCVEEGD